MYFRPGFCFISYRYSRTNTRSRQIVSYRTGNVSIRTACEAMLRLAVVPNAKTPIKNSATMARIRWEEVDLSVKGGQRDACQYSLTLGYRSSRRSRLLTSSTIRVFDPCRALPTFVTSAGLVPH